MDGEVDLAKAVTRAREMERKTQEFVARMEQGLLEVDPEMLNNQPKSAVELLTEGANCIGDRASERDTESERSMARTVKAFNAMFNKDLTETEGWQFMELLKVSRSVGGKFREDDFVDGAAYAALAGECAATSGRTS